MMVGQERDTGVKAGGMADRRILPQEALIARVREVCRRDERLVGALMYGSFTRGEGDAFSDIEFALFFADDTLDAVDPRTWVEEIAPVALYFVNEFGNGAAIFENLVRGEFHFDRASDMARIEGWRDSAAFPSLDATLILDRTGALTHHLRTLVGPGPARDTPAQVRALSHSFVNWTLFGVNVLARGESARALHLLSFVDRDLLWLARLVEGATDHWPTPAKGIEQDLSPAARARYAACTAALDREALRRAYAAACPWGRELLAALAARHGIDLPVALLERIAARLAMDDRADTP